MRQRQIANNRQLGITLSGFCVIVLVVISYAIFALATIPLVGEYYGVRKVMVDVASLSVAELGRNSKIRDHFIRRADINNLSNFGESALRKHEDRLVIETNRKTKVKTMILTYESEKHLFYNFYLLFRAKESIELGTGQTETVAVSDEEEE